jgi:tetratricopeptide (TPR) repeat protein
MERDGPAAIGRPATLLRELLGQRYLLPYRRFCREYDTVARALDPRLIGSYPSESTYKRWLSGRVAGTPRSDACAVLAVMFPEHTVEQLLAPRSSEPEGADRLVRITSGELATDRTALDASAAVLAETRRLEDIAGPSTVIPITRSQRALVTLLARNAKGPVRPIAVGLLSELEQYLGWLHMAPAVERWPESQRHLDRATTLALEADDPVRLSTALSYAADRYFRMHETESAVALNEGSSRDERVHISLRTFNAYHKAAILARDGAHHDVVTALQAADALVELLPPAAELPDYGYWYTPGFFHGQRALILDELGDRRAARRLADEAIAAIPDAWTKSEWSGRRRRLEQIG